MIFNVVDYLLNNSDNIVFGVFCIGLSVMLAQQLYYRD